MWKVVEADKCQQASNMVFTSLTILFALILTNFEAKVLNFNFYSHAKYKYIPNIYLIYKYMYYVYINTLFYTVLSYLSNTSKLNIWFVRKLHDRIFKIIFPVISTPENYKNRPLYLRPFFHCRPVLWGMLHLHIYKRSWYPEFSLFILGYFLNDC